MDSWELGPPHSRKPEPARAEYWHGKMIEKGVQPNAYSFSALINAFAKAGEVDAASSHLKKMEKARVPGDVVVYSGVLDACAKANDMDKAVAIFRQMRVAGIRPNVVAYASLARPFAHAGDWQKVEELAKEMQSYHLEMNAYFLYTLLIAHASARPRQAERAEAAFKAACDRGIEINKHVLSALSRAVGRARCHQLARDAGLTDTGTRPTAAERDKERARARRPDPNH